MYYIGKIVQATGLVVILFAFVARFPKLMDFKIFLAGLLFFSCGWALERYLLKS